MSIRPVTARWPSSSKLWEETSLPLSCVVIPFSVSTSSSDKIEPLCNIPKCLECGAPQQDVTHTSVHSATANLCHLCASITSRLFRDQKHGRPLENLQESSYRRRGSSSNVFSLPLYSTIYTMPAIVCPPTWWIVVDGTPTCRQYWNTVATSLQQVCEKMPSHIHVGLLVATPTSLGVYDLASAIPHLLHYNWQCSLPHELSISPNPSNLQAALRAMGDVTTSGRSFNQRNNSNNKMPLGATLEIILATLASHCHPGNASGGDVPTYAGGRILIILGGPPAEITLQKKKVAPGTSIGTGGVGGSCSEIGQRYNKSKRVGHASNDIELGTGSAPDSQQQQPQDDETEMTATNLSKYYKTNKKTPTEVYYSELGQECARAGLGVDVLVLKQTKDEPIGVPFLRLLSDASGTPGPLIVSTPNEFQHQLQYKTPWYAPMAFGGTLRIRASPGFRVDVAPVEVGNDDDGPQLAPLYSKRGLLGPATCSQQQQQQEGLWNIGCCDEYTAVTIDLTVSSKVKDRLYVDGMGHVAIQHSLQTCFAYTTIEYDETSGDYMTVRRLLINSMNLPLAHDTESLYATLDPEALAVVLFHKLTIASLQDGLIPTHEIGLEWLVSLLTCVYRSALREEELQKEQLSRGLDNMNPVFYPQERLLNRQGGELSAQDVLLAQGHERLNSMVLMVYCLLQCDALRPCKMGDLHHPTMDARCAASAQMYSTVPSVLARCIAPRVELWASNDDDEPIEQDLDLSLEHIGLSIMEHCQTANDGELVLFIDTPREILVCDARHLQPSSSNDGDTNKAVIGKGLEKCIEIAASSYRVPPPIVYETLSHDALERVKDVLVEDAPTVQGLENFEQWKQEVAAMVQEGLQQ